MKQFNINDVVKVKLTKFGESAYLAHHKQYNPEAELPTKDSQGYSEFQLWKLMSTFGSHMYNGGDISFEGVRMLIKDKDLVDFEPEGESNGS